MYIINSEWMKGKDDFVGNGTQNVDSEEMLQSILYDISTILPARNL